MWSAYAYALSVLRVGLVHVGVTEKSYHAANQATGKAEIEAGEKKNNLNFSLLISVLLLASVSLPYSLQTRKTAEL